MNKKCFYCGKPLMEAGVKQQKIVVIDLRTSDNGGVWYHTNHSDFDNAFHLQCWSEVAGKDYALPVSKAETDSSFIHRILEALQCPPMDLSGATGDDLDKIGEQFGLRRIKGKT